MKTWWFISSAPRDATWIEVMMWDGTIHRAHWAEDLSGEEQPPFRGWFISTVSGLSFIQIPTPELWRDIHCPHCYKSSGWEYPNLGVNMPAGAAWSIASQFALSRIHGANWFPWVKCMKCNRSGRKPRPLPPGPKPTSERPSVVASG